MTTQGTPLTLRDAAPDRKPQHECGFVLRWGGVDWDCCVWYDAEGGRDDLELDVWRVVLETWNAEGRTVYLPPGVYVEPDQLPPHILWDIIEHAADSWHWHREKGRA